MAQTLDLRFVLLLLHLWIQYINSLTFRLIYVCFPQATPSSATSRPTRALIVRLGTQTYHPAKRVAARCYSATYQQPRVTASACWQCLIGTQLPALQGQHAWQTRRLVARTICTASMPRQAHFWRSDDSFDSFAIIELQMPRAKKQDRRRSKIADFPTSDCSTPLTCTTPRSDRVAVPTRARVSMCFRVLSFLMHSVMMNTILNITDMYTALQ